MHKEMNAAGTVQWLMKSPIGPLFLVASSEGLQGIYWKKQSAPMAKTLLKAPGEADAATRILALTVEQLNQYFTGERKKFELPMALKGTDFQLRVWKELAKIPFGKTCSYRDIAKKIKNEKAVRAVGTANGKNPLCIIVPCHRVIAADGTLGGYSGGLNLKKKLLQLESRSQNQ